MINFKSLILAMAVLLIPALALVAEGKKDAPASQSAQPAPSAQAPAPEQKTRDITLVLGTSAAGGTWYPATQVMAQAIQNELPGVKVTVMPGGSVSNIMGMGTRQYDIALAHTQDIADALKGVGVFKEKVSGVRALMSLWTNYLQIAVRPDAGINGVKDLKGKRIAPGQRGWGGEIATSMVLKLNGLSYNDMAKVEFTGWTGMVDLYKDRHIDAAVACSTLGVSAFQEMALLGDGIKLLPLEPAVAQKATEENAGYFLRKLPANSYRGQTQSVDTLGSTTILFCRDDLPEDLAYDIVKVLLAHRKDLVTALSAFEELNPVFAAVVPGVELHSGADRYYRETGAKK